MKKWYGQICVLGRLFWLLKDRTWEDKSIKEDQLDVIATPSPGQKATEREPGCLRLRRSTHLRTILGDKI